MLVTQDPLATDYAGEPRNPLRHQLRVLDQMDAMRHDAGHEQLAVGQPDVLPDLPFVLMPRIRSFDHDRHPARTCSIRSAKYLSSKSCTRGAMFTL